MDEGVWFDLADPRCVRGTSSFVSSHTFPSYLMLFVARPG